MTANVDHIFLLSDRKKCMLDLEYNRLYRGL